jgi:hypothetical protein
MVQTTAPYIRISNNRTLEIGLNTDTFSAVTQPFNVDIYYQNYSSNEPHKLNIQDLRFAGTNKPPSAPQNTFLLSNTISNVTINIGNPEYSVMGTPNLKPSDANKLNSNYITIQRLRYQTRRFPFGNNLNINCNIFCNVNIINKISPLSNQTNILGNLQADTLYNIAVGADHEGYKYPGGVPYMYNIYGEIGPSNLVVSQQLITAVTSNGNNRLTYTFNTYEYYPAFSAINGVRVTVTGIGSNYRSERFNISNVEIISATTNSFTVACNILGSACNLDLVPSCNLQFTNIQDSGTSATGFNITYGAPNNPFAANQYITITGIGHTGINPTTFIGSNSPFNISNALITNKDINIFTVTTNNSVSGTISLTAAQINGTTSSFQTSNITIIGASNTGTGQIVKYITSANHGFNTTNFITITGIGTFYSQNFNLSSRNTFTTDTNDYA